jgi:glycosyltransferase involved in cell wall biosynthesis
MVLHGAGWFVQPELWKKSDVMYQKFATPIYCQAADFLVSNSDLTTQDFQEIFKIPNGKIRTVNLAAGENFRRVSETSILNEVRKKYNLPEKFVLTVTSYDPARKNFDTLLAAYEEARKKVGVDLLVVGKNCERYAQDFDFKKKGLESSVHFTGWVEQQDLPAIYSLAETFLFPSVYETFGIPVVEAMACGCPVVASDTGAIPSLVKEAGLLCSPFDKEQLARNLLRILTSEETASRFRRLGLERAKEFSWEKAARQTLKIFESVVYRF